MQRYKELFGYLVRDLIREGHNFTEACNEVLAAGRLNPRITVDDLGQLEPYTDGEALLGFKAYNAINRLKRQYAERLQEKIPESILPGANFLHLFNPLLQALKDLGGSARPIEVRNHVAKILWFLDRERYKLLEVGTPRFNNLLLRAKFYLVKAGYLYSAYGGDWTLTEKGLDLSTLSPEEVLSIFKRVHAELSKSPQDQDVPGSAYTHEEEFCLQASKSIAAERDTASPRNQVSSNESTEAAQKSDFF